MEVDIIEQLNCEITELKKTITKLQIDLLELEKISTQKYRDLHIGLSQAAHKEINAHKSAKDLFEHKIIHKVCVQVFLAIDVLHKYLAYHQVDAKTVEAVNIFTDSIQQVLSDANVHKIIAQNTEEFDPSIHRSIDTVNTTDKALVGKIHEMKTAGLVYKTEKSEKTVLPVEVTTYNLSHTE